MKKFKTLLFFLALTSVTFAQTDLKKGSHPITPSSDNAYLYAEWLPAVIHLTDNTSQKVNARYNVALQEMEIQDQANEFSLDQTLSKKVVINNVSFVPKFEGKGFYQELESTPLFTFYKQFIKKPGQKLQVQLYKKNIKTGKMMRFKKEGIQKNPFIIDNTAIEKLSSVKEVKENNVQRTIINGAYQGKNGLGKTSEREGVISTGITTFDNREKTVTGSVFLNDKAAMASVYLKNENKKIIAPVRFNVETNEFILYFNNKTITLDPLQIKKVIFNKKIFIPYSDLQLNVNFYQYLGKLNGKELLKKYYIEKIDETYIPGKSTGDLKQRRKIKSKFLVSNTRTGSIKPIKKNKKTLLALFGKKQKQIEKYVKQNKINIKNSEQLARLIKYYHTL